MNRYFTKSIFKSAIECPTKLFYIKKDNYSNQKNKDTFLQALAEGGLQVGALAKTYFPDGHNIKDLDYVHSLKETNKLLEKDSISIFEAAINFNSFFIRTDILLKQGNEIELIEVKSKSYKDGDTNKFHTTKWIDYLRDVAFQKYVLQKAYPSFNIKSFLMLVDKDKPCPVNGLFGKFKIKKDKNNKKRVIVSSELSEEDKKENILTQVNVDQWVDEIIKGQGLVDNAKSFAEEIQYFAEKYEKNEKIKTDLGKKCKTCEFRCSDEQRNTGLKDGFRECWKEKAQFNDSDFKSQTIFDLNNFRKTDEFIKQGKIKLKDLSQSGLTRTYTQRQWIQIEKDKNNDKTPWVDFNKLKREIDKWKFPLHFIDFETSTPAIPFTKGRKPYEEITFQFSHHTVSESGKIEHKKQYINTTPSFFPNFEFLRALKLTLEKDKGTIFRYWDHEKTYLKKIANQLKQSNEPDKEDLLSFIQTIIKIDSGPRPERCMVDLGKEVIVKYYQSPLTKGSNSIKKILPAILNHSEFLQEKYSQPIYGTNEMKSLNFTDKIWAKEENGKFLDPYKLLNSNSSSLDDANSEQIERLISSQFSNIDEGGEAMMAYHYLQFPDISNKERQHIKVSLLRYCELDTFAMVMIYEYLKDICK